MSHSPSKTWTELRELIAAGDAVPVQQFLDRLSPIQIARALSRIPSDEREQLVTLIDPDEAAEVLEDVADVEAAEIVEDLPPERAAAILDGLPDDRQADLLGELSEAEAGAILEAMPVSRAEDIRQLMSYAPDTAGGLMTTEYVAYPESSQVQQVVSELRARADEYADYQVQYVYVIDANGRLRGVVGLRELLFARKARALSEIMLGDPLRVTTSTTLRQLRNVFEERAFLGAPVTDDAGRLVGVVHRGAVNEALRRQSSRVFLAVSGIVGGEELRSMPLLKRASRRASWLSINIVLNIIAASVIALYQGTLEQAIALAVFLPIISDMSGCSGGQAVAVSLRELTLGYLRPRELGRVLAKEIPIGIVNGVVLGGLLALAAVAWKGNPWLGLVVGAALAANTLISVCLGGLMPLLVRRLRLDPALVSGPALTTLTDTCGFFLVLSLASLVLPRIAG